jgi:hypothetical protein
LPLWRENPMTSSMQKRLKLSALSFVMAMLFSAGMLLGGSEFVGFPWGPLAGAVCWVILSLLVLKLGGNNNVRM